MKYFRFIALAVSLAVMLGLGYLLGEMRVKNATQKTHEALIRHMSSFLNAVDQQVFIYGKMPDPQSRLYQRMREQITAIKTVYPGRNYFTIAYKDEKFSVGICAFGEKELQPGDPYSLSKSLSDSLFVSKKPAVITEHLPNDRIRLKVLVPMMSSPDQKSRMIAALEMDGDMLTATTKQIRRQTNVAVSILAFLIVMTAVAIFWRNGQTEHWRKKLKHIETVAVFLIGLWLIVISIYAYNVFQRQEQALIFNGYGENHAANLRNVMRDMRHNMEQFSVFVANSQKIDAAEFESFAKHMLGTHPFESVYFFESGAADSPAGMRINDSGGQQLYLRYQFVRPGGMTIPDPAPVKILNLLEKNLRESQKDFTVYSSDFVFLDQDDRGAFLLGIAVPHQGVNGQPTDKRSFLTAVLSPDHLLYDTFRRNEWLRSLIAIGLMHYTHEGGAHWVASYPHGLHGMGSTIDMQKHLSAYQLNETFPVFIWGEVFSVTVHSLPDFEKGFHGFSSNFFFLLGLSLNLIITSLVFLIRQRWVEMETLVENRTRSLNRRVSDLECIRLVSETLQAGQPLKQKWEAALQAVESTLFVRDDACIALLIGGEEFTSSTVSESCETKISADIFCRGKRMGLIAVKSCKAITFQKEDTALLSQVAQLIGDFLQQQEMSMALKESETKFRTLVENAFDAIYIIENKQFKYVNNAFCKMVGYPPEELTDPQFNLELLLTEKSKAIVQQRFEARQKGLTLSHRYEFQQRSKSGDVIDVEASTVAVELDNRQVIIGMLHDITERKANEHALMLSEEKLQQQNEELQVLNEELKESNEQIMKINSELFAAKARAEASDKLKTAFLNNINHEVRTPLNGITGAASVLVLDAATEAERKEMLQVIEQSTARLIRTIGQYVDISMLNSGTMSVQNEHINLRNWLLPIIGRYTKECISKKLLFDFELPGHETETIYCDKNLLGKILDHLLDNALKFTTKGSIKCHFKPVSTGLWEIAVHDTGVGMEETFIHQMFDVFMQEDVSNIRKYDGSGLGLPIVKKCCELLGAQIRVESFKNKGTSIFITLPVNNNNNSSEIQHQKIVMTPLTHHPAILIAEDEDSNFVVLNMLLIKRLGANVLRAYNGEEAVQLAQLHSEVELVLMDMKMPVMDGYEATRRIRQFNPKIPIIAITAYGLTGDEHKALSAGCSDYMAKPIQTTQLIEKVSAWLQNHQ